MLRVVSLALLLSAIIVRAASAQGAYVSASLVGDLVRVNHAGTGSDDSAGGEALGFALRLGAEVGSRWGVEVEFARPSEIESDESPGVVPLPAEITFIELSGPSGASAPSFDALFPSFQYRFRTRQRNSTLSATVWVRQEVSRRVSLAYIGGVGFHRTQRDFEITFEPLRPTIGLPVVFPPSLTETMTYTAGPLAGVEARIALTDHVQLVPGVRLHGITGGWLVRSSVGLGWVF